MADLLWLAGSGVCPHDATTLARITHRNADFVTPARTIAGNVPHRFSVDALKNPRIDSAFWMELNASPSPVVEMD
jgi:hypothetical protein